MFYETHTLSNGIRLLHVPAASSVVYCGFVVNAGTRDERSDEQGMAHFVEHMLFKGTEHRKSWQVISRLESFGGQIDAYTTKEETYIYATVPQAQTERAVELLADIVLHSTFPATELEHERGVVVEEILLYNDSPAELVYDDFEDLLFGGSSLGHNILGNEASLQTIDAAKMRTFVQRCYTTDSLVFYLFGQVDFAKMVRWAERYFAVPATHRAFVRQQPTAYAPQTLRQRRDTFQTHCVLGNRAYHLTHDDRFALLLLNNILGGPNMSSRLNMAVRERNGLAYTIESNLTSYVDTGVWNIYFGCDQGSEKRCMRLIDNELRRLQETPLTERQLHKAKCQLDGQMLISDENRENLILSMAKSFLQVGYCLSNAEMHEQIAAVSAEKLQQVAADIFAFDKRTTLIFC